MIDLYYFPTPNAKKISIALEELNLDYRIIKIDILAREQFSSQFLEISPNNKIPAIVDHMVKPEISLFESGAILLYLAEKTGKLCPLEPQQKWQVQQWLFWQIAGFGPMAGQSNHFNHYAREQVPYAQQRYRQELTRLYTVLDKQLAGNAYICEEYSIADIACYPWVEQADRGGIDINQFSNVKSWFERISTRPAVIKGMAVSNELTPDQTLDNKAFDSLFKNEPVNS
ncbi:glutathione S-transferase N-terminal domain-containing protein [Thalassotalea psychrophila]|uniref:Glutathione S-transferase N-terminal domain-containing protein n=1 Tax=Thalassotalea psychrophila TaxID=3065647 RepID=A0ABY9TTP3_9GAMM|nr:glutathione S-transferase N-terminal domain-containing protein [Colwelliaceae bacterium SQ149]